MDVKPPNIDVPPNIEPSKRMGLKKHRVQTQNTESRCTQTLYAPNKKAVCDNIEHENQEYEG
jgi:hypothetical protein